MEIVAAIVGRKKGTVRAIKNYVGWKDVRPAKAAKIKNVVDEK